MERRCAPVPGQRAADALFLPAHQGWNRRMNHREENDSGRPEPRHATDEPPVMHSFCNSEDIEDVCMTDSRTPTRLPVLDAPAEWRYLGPHPAYGRHDPKGRANMAPTLAEIEAVGYLRMKGKWQVPMEMPPADAGSKHVYT